MTCIILCQLSSTRKNCTPIHLRLLWSNIHFAINLRALADLPWILDPCISRSESSSLDCELCEVILHPKGLSVQLISPRMVSQLKQSASRGRHHEPESKRQPSASRADVLPLSYRGHGSEANYLSENSMLREPLFI